MDSRMMDSRVPYERLANAQANCERQFPGATRIRTLWTPGSEHEICAEIWYGDRANVVGVRGTD